MRPTVRIRLSAVGRRLAPEALKLLRSYHWLIIVMLLRQTAHLTLYALQEGEQDWPSANSWVSEDKGDPACSDCRNAAGLQTDVSPCLTCFICDLIFHPTSHVSVIEMLSSGQYICLLPS